MIIEGVNQFLYKGKKSFDDIGLIMTRPPTFDPPERDISFISVPGRSGDIIDDRKRFKNSKGTYPVEIFKDDFDIPLVIKKMRAWLQPEPGYFPLSDTYNPNYFYMASYSGGVRVEQELQYIGKSTLPFNCKPFKYSFEGQQPVNVSATAKLYNPEDWESTPYLKIKGSGNITLHINNMSFSFIGVKDYIEIDGEMMMVYKATELQNDKAQFTTFPKLAAGMNNISFTGAVTQITIVPRWCCL